MSEPTYGHPPHEPIEEDDPVWWIPDHAGDRAHEDAEKGTVKRIGSEYVYVEFQRPAGRRVNACYPRHLQHR